MTVARTRPPSSVLLIAFLLAGCETINGNEEGYERPLQKLYQKGL